MPQLSRAVPVLLAIASSLTASAWLGAQPLDDVIPLGVRYTLDADPARRRQTLEEIGRLRFNVVALSEDAASAQTELGLISRMLGGAADARVRASGIVTIPAEEASTPAGVKLAAWYAFGMGARGILFGEWDALKQNVDALTAAVEFAEHVSRNATLYAPLRPRIPPSADRPDVAVDGSDPRISARFLESADALLLIVTNHAAEPREVRLVFSPEMPEAIWQNMLTGATVNFVAESTGPVYTRTFPPKDVLVLMIRKALK